MSISRLSKPFSEYEFWYQEVFRSDTPTEEVLNKAVEVFYKFKVNNALFRNHLPSSIYNKSLEKKEVSSYDERV